MLLISGGVSAGKWDLVIPVLESERVRSAIHQVRLRPGRPLYVGVRGRKIVFALPGNPVSTFVLFEVFVRPFLRRMMGLPEEGRRMRARLASPVRRKSPRTQYLPARVADGKAVPLEWHGSADLCALARANGFVVVPAGTRLGKGATVDVHLLS